MIEDNFRYGFIKRIDELLNDYENAVDIKHKDEHERDEYVNPYGWKREIREELLQLIQKEFVKNAN
jgi:hypothetical protein